MGFIFSAKPYTDHPLGPSYYDIINIFVHFNVCIRLTTRLVVQYAETIFVITRLSTLLAVKWGEFVTVDNPVISSSYILLYTMYGLICCFCNDPDATGRWSPIDRITLHHVCKVITFHMLIRCSFSYITRLFPIFYCDHVTCY